MTAELAYVSQLLNCNVVKGQKHATQYSTNPKTLKERERKSNLSARKAMLERTKANDNSAISYHIKQLKKDEIYLSSSKKDKIEWEDRARKGMLDERFR